MISQQFFKFITIGILGTTLNYLAFLVFYEFLSINYILSSSLGFIIGTVTGYGFNKVWTFGIKCKDTHYAYKYYLVYIISLFLGLALLKFLVAVLNIMPEIANLLTIGLTTCTNFIGTKFWVFKK
jgi:putative flippase GtrA